MLKSASRAFSTSRALLKKTPQMPPRPKVDENEIRESFIRGSGPGGQCINRRSTRCQITHIPTGLVVSSQKTRSLEENRKIARQILADKLELMFAPPGTSRKDVVGAFKKNKIDRAQKKKDRKYKQLSSGAEEEAELANQKAKEAFEQLMKQLGK
ncbi:YALIA101S04e16094g1_1 [Yarrowia lipolytica]|nr:YALIA101S04e16094g1_1 [Yarrowia lipolytica]